eukprot:TRINITY_DN68169_c0_g1_i1.p2 TRINITY_DN68169_c0_g1~~TRINITY_DN68169_c0_g1_i1.p2  ORF type:complete len:258 (-),score=56.23 TRINITY_DN68169_c0_g1_i1:54-776(-)
MPSAGAVPLPRMHAPGFVEELEDAVSVDEDLERMRLAWAPGRRRRNGRHGLASAQASPRTKLSTVPEDALQKGRVFGGEFDASLAARRLQRVAPGREERQRLLEGLVPPATPALSEISSRCGSSWSRMQPFPDDCSEFGDAASSCGGWSLAASSASKGFLPSHARHALQEGLSQRESWDQKWQRHGEAEARRAARHEAVQEAVALRDFRLALAQRHAVAAKASARPDEGGGRSSRKTAAK